MNNVRMDGESAWCGHVGCPHPQPLATMQYAKDGTAFARFTTNRWIRDGLQEGLERYRQKGRSESVITILPDGRRHKRWPRGLRAVCPAVIVCPSCGNVQTIGLTPPRPSR